MEHLWCQVQPAEGPELVGGQLRDWPAQAYQLVFGSPGALDDEPGKRCTLGVEQVDLACALSELGDGPADPQGDRCGVSRAPRVDETAQRRLEATVDQKVQVIELTLGGSPLRNRDLSIRHAADCAIERRSQMERRSRDSVECCSAIRGGGCRILAEAKRRCTTQVRLR
ncbi:MAG: hypothetical protein WKF82_07720 [Nocardioidaceae bacterium]